VTTIKFGTDGWRGVIADDFTYENVRKVACAIARYIARAEKPNAGILVGYDTRFGSERFARVAAEVVSMTGMPVWVAEKACPSPALSLLVRQRGAAGGIMITASHNPYRWNGVKFKASYGSSALPSIVARVEKELATVLADGVPPLPAQPASTAHPCRQDCSSGRRSALETPGAAIRSVPQPSVPAGLPPSWLLHVFSPALGRRWQRRRKQQDWRQVFRRLQSLV